MLKKYQNSARKLNEPVKMRMGGKSLADFSDENLSPSVQNEKFSIGDNASKNDSLSVNISLKNPVNMSKGTKQQNPHHAHKNSDSNAIIPNRRMKYLNGNGSDDMEVDVPKN